jgi:hypothetical protein
MYDIKVYNLHKSLRYTYDMWAYIAKQYKNATVDLQPTTHGSIMQLGRSVEDVSHEPYMDN